MIRPLAGVALWAALAAAPTLALPVPRPLLPTSDGPVVTVGALRFRANDYDLRVIEAGGRPHEGATVIEPYGTRDTTGVAKRVDAAGRLHDHPVNQAQYVVNMLRSWRLTGEDRYLDAAIVNAERLLARAVREGDALFYPYPFDFYLHGRGMLRAPWYSAMAQGIALSGFVRLHEVTGEPTWMAAARGTFASFLRPHGFGRPWVSAVDGELLWFEEYPWSPLDHTFNGHNFALFGLYDYWAATGDDTARSLLEGGLTTAEAVAPLVRVPGGISRYCVAGWCLVAGVQNPRYHGVHVRQLHMLHRLTGDADFLRLADALAADPPSGVRSGRRG